jgi:POT family proton-dependent oligopeptide transporter
VYLTPFIGGLLADRIFGYRKTIVAGGALMAAGYLTLAIPGPRPSSSPSFLIIIGNGLFKPNISTLLGNLYNKPEYVKLKDGLQHLLHGHQHRCLRLQFRGSVAAQ